MKANHVILGIHVADFATQSGQVQKILSEYGCSIRTRVGLHDVADGVCSPNGLILVEFIGGEDRADEMSIQLGNVNGVEVKKMIFGH